MKYFDLTKYIEAFMHLVEAHLAVITVHVF